MRKSYFVIAALLLMLTAACEGGPLCGPLSDPQSDVDADCVENNSDNCPDVYNPDQIDLDTDGLGAACDENDGDAACGPNTDTSDGDCATVD